jgi:hypothetical protein
VVRGASWIVLLGGNVLNAGFVELARRRGARLLVVDWNDAPSVTGDRHLKLDIKDSDHVLADVCRLVDDALFVYTSSDVATETAARIHGAYGLERPPADALATARHKPTMNELWDRDGLLHKRYASCTALDELSAFHLQGPGDSIVKPASAASSRGVTVVRAGDDEAQLRAAFARARHHDDRDRVVIEEYVEGTEFSVEMVGDRSGHVRVAAIGRKYHSANAGRNRVASKIHYNPPGVPRGERARIADVARRCYLALGLRSSLAQLELIARPDGQLVPLELGARSSGYIATHLVDAATCAAEPLLASYERMLRGGSVADDLLEPRRSSMVVHYDLPAGVGRRPDTNLMRFMAPGIESLAHDRSALVAGRRFGPIDGDADRVGFEILSGDCGTLTVEAVLAAEAAHRRTFLKPERASAPELPSAA